MVLVVVQVNRLTFMSLWLYVIAANLIERAAAALASSGSSSGGKDQFKRVAAEMLLDGLHIVNIMSSLIVPCVIVTVYETPMFGAFLTVFQAVVTWMKIISYVAVNQHYRSKLAATSHPSDPAAKAVSTKDDTTAAKPRHERRDSPTSTEGRSSVTYPNNLTLGDIFYFLAVPTLCYELNFPRTPRIRVKRPPFPLLEDELAPPLATTKGDAQTCEVMHHGGLPMCICLCLCAGAVCDATIGGVCDTPRHRHPVDPAVGSTACCHNTQRRR
jgi:hypothetical protein